MDDDIPLGEFQLSTAILEEKVGSFSIKISNDILMNMIEDTINRVKWLPVCLRPCSPSSLALFACIPNLLPDS